MHRRLPALVTMMIGWPGSEGKCCWDAGSLYKQKDELEGEVKKQDMFKWCKSFKYAFKVRDKSKPSSWYIPQDLTILPPQDELEPTVGEKVGQWASDLRARLGKLT